MVREVAAIHRAAPRQNQIETVVAAIKRVNEAKKAKDVANEAENSAMSDAGRELLQLREQTPTGWEKVCKNDLGVSPQWANTMIRVFKGKTTPEKLRAGVRASAKKSKKGEFANSVEADDEDDQDFKSETERFQYLLDRAQQRAYECAQQCLDYLPKAQKPGVPRIRKVIDEWEKVLKEAQHGTSST